jgi:hypothetical protein
MNRLERAVIRLDADFRALGVKWALIGGLAVSVRSQPRTTWDVDVAVAVANDRDAMQLILALRARGYRDRPSGALHEQAAVGRIAGMRLLAPEQDDQGLAVDLLFAFSGVETEAALSAEPIEVFRGVVVPVARIGYLVAMKVLAGRPRDLEDVSALLGSAGMADLQLAQDALELIERRGYGSDLLTKLARIRDSS